MACAFGELVKDYYYGKMNFIRPHNFMRVVAKNRQFSNAAHQDSQEFLSHFLDKLHEDLNRVKVKPST